jgi:hypothetical protein
MATNSLIAYLEKKYGKDSKKIISNYKSQKQKYVEQGKK